MPKKPKKGPKAPSPPSKPEILKKIKLASFDCDLKAVNWSDEYVDFYWADTPEISNVAKPITGNLKVTRSF